MLLDDYRNWPISSWRHCESSPGSACALEEVEEARVRTMCVGQDITKKEVEGLKE